MLRLNALKASQELFPPLPNLAAANSPSATNDSSHEHLTGTHSHLLNARRLGLFKSTFGSGRGSSGQGCGAALDLVSSSLIVK